ncbi:MAG: hypothetical protein GXO47_12915 [Chlorobi bacterium]|nr:hypothetical protein [Chlorobiota bacterium]
MTKFILAIFFALGVLACSNSDELSVCDIDVYQGYRFEYDEYFNITEVGAVFRAGSREGEKVKLVPPAFLTVNDEICSDFNVSEDFPYTIDYESRLPMAVVDFVDFKENMYAHCFMLDSLATVGDVNVYTDSVKHTIVVTFTGECKTENETFEIVISGNNGKSIKFDVEPGEDNVIVVDNDIVEEFSGELVELKLVRIKTVELENISSAGGDLQLVYSSQVKEVQL